MSKLANNTLHSSKKPLIQPLLHKDVQLEYKHYHNAHMMA